MTGEPTTPEEAAKIKRYFTEKIASLNRSKIIYRDRLLQGSDRLDPTIWDKIMINRPESAISFLAYRTFVETFEMLDILADSIIELEKDVKKIDDNLQAIGQKNNVDISVVTKDVTDLKQKILPAVKGMVSFIDRMSQDEERRKKNGENMVV